LTDFSPELRVASPRRITLVANELRGFLPVGGMGTATTFLALALARLGHSPEVLLGWRPDRALDPYWEAVYRRAEIRIRRASETGVPVEPEHFAVMRNVECALRADPPDVVIAHEFGAPAYAALRLRQAGLAFEDTLFVAFCHGARRYAMDIAPNLGTRDLQRTLAVASLEQASVELADVVVTPSAYLMDWMRSRGWRLPDRTHVIPYFTRSDATGEASARAPATEGTALQRLAFFGRVDERKGLKPFAGALNALEPELLDGLELEFVGKTTATWTRNRVLALLSESTISALRRVTFHTGLDQHEALALLMRPGTLAVMPSLRETFSNTVYECLEHGIPFIASNVGGIPELVASEDRDRVLFEPTREGVEAALRDVLSRGVPRPARLAFDTAASFDHWANVVGLRPRVGRAILKGAVDVVVVHRRSSARLARCLSAVAQQSYADFSVIVVTAGAAAPRVSTGDELQYVVVEADGVSVEAARKEGLRAGSAPYIVFLDEDDIPEPLLLETLVRAQHASRADVVTCGLRLSSDEGDATLHFFTGEPGGLGALSNGYGNVALFRRAVLDDLSTPWPTERDPDWPLLARLSLTGTRIVSLPVPLVARTARPGSVERDPSDALLVLNELEQALPDPLRSTARVAAGLAANSSRARNPPTSSVRRIVGRLFAGGR
jgi:O-antigen biosynthesis protein